MSEWQKLDAYLDSIGVPHGAPTLCGTDGDPIQCPMHAPTSNHFRGLARDYGDQTNDCVRIVNAFLPLWNQGLLLELYYAPTNTWLPTNVGAHTDHVHVAIKPGAILVPGADMPLSADDLSKITTIVQQQIANECAPGGHIFKLSADFFNNQFQPLLADIQTKVGTPRHGSWSE